METFIRQKRSVTLDNFAEVADLILNHTLLITSTKRFRICEIEFYLCEMEQEQDIGSSEESASEDESELETSEESETKELHQDEYTHNNPDQLTYGRFYFHKMSKNNYKVGTYKCCDITAGSVSENKYCGILIRSVYDLSQNKIADVKKRTLIEGPCNSVRAILGCYDCEEVIEFTGGKLLSVLQNEYDFVIRDDTAGELQEEQVWKGLRYNLNKTRYPEYWNRKYRYLIMKNKIKKSKSSLEMVD